MISTTTTRTELQGNGTLTGYNADFTILADGDIEVYVAGVKKNLTSDYTVANAGTSTNAAVSFTSGSFPSPGASLASSVSVLLVRTLTLTQPSNYQNNDIFDAETLEQSLDRATQQIQQINTNLDRSFHFGDTVTGITSASTVISADASTRANKAIKFSSDGTTVGVSTYDPDTYATSASSFADASAASATTAQGHANTASTHKDTAQEWATKVDGQVASTEYSAKAWAQSTDVNAPALGSAKEWTLGGGGSVANAVADGEYSAKYHAEQAKSKADAAALSAAQASATSIAMAIALGIIFIPFLN
jgi:hypothetical protein